MPRRRRAAKRTVSPDPKYNSELVARVINSTMRGGKKSVAERIVYGAMARLDKEMKEPAIEVLVRAMDNMKPRVEVKSRRVGGSTYQVPVEVSRDRQLALALRWLVDAARQRRGVPMQKAVADELMDAYRNQGNVVRRREETHRMAQANRAFAHYAW